MDAQTADLAAQRPGPRRVALGARLRDRDTPLRDAALAAATAFVIVCVAGVGSHLLLGSVPHGGLDPAGVVDHLGSARDALAAPFARWDSVWFLTIARDGYVTGQSAAFFPLYPLAVAAVGALGPGLLLGGVLVSLTSFVAALRLLYRLTELELGHRLPDAPRLVVLTTALGPMSFFFTAIYSESLYLATTLGAFLAARQGRWARAGALGGLAAATRSQGLLLVGALALIQLDQHRHPRADGTPRPRRRDAAWLLGIPLGTGAYLGWLWLTGIDPLAPFAAQEAWFRHFTGPQGGVLQGATAAFDGARQLLSGQTRTIYFTAAGGDPMTAAWHNLLLFGFMLGALPPLVGALRRLPPAYGAYALAGLVVALSYPVGPQPLASLPRYLVVLFPLQMAFGAWLAGRPRLRAGVLAAGAASLAVDASLFATWHWIA